MRKGGDQSGAELFRGVLLVHAILGLHLLLLALLGLLVIFFGGIARYWGWIVGGGIVLAAAGAFLVLRRARAQGRSLIRELRGTALLPGGSLEVSLLGGIASVTLRRPPARTELPGQPPTALLEAPETASLRELSRLAAMYEKSLITREEFERAKRAIFNPPGGPPLGAGPCER